MFVTVGIKAIEGRCLKMLIELVPVVRGRVTKFGPNGALDARIGESTPYTFANWTFSYVISTAKGFIITFKYQKQGLETKRTQRWQFVSYHKVDEEMQYDLD